MPGIEPVHLVFDCAAVILALLGGWLVYCWRLREAVPVTAASVGLGYFLCLWLGSILGAYFFGTLNLYLLGIHETGRSIVGAWFGAIVSVEIYKWRKSITRSTGYIYVVPLCILVIVGRFGCFFSGIGDQTYGTPTALPWGWDFGDHIRRHPVQLYESAAMLAFLVAGFALLKYRSRVFIRYGFYLCIGYYAVQRWLWEFFKPYAKLAGPFNVFHYVCMVLILYSLWMCRREYRAHAVS